MLRVDNSKYKIFTKVGWNKRAIIYYILLVFTSLSYAVLFNDIQIKVVAHDTSDKLLLFFTAFSYCLLLFYLLMLSRWVFIIVTPLLFYVGTISYVYTTQLGFNITAKTAPLFFTEKVVNAIIDININAIAIIFFFILAIILGFIRFFFAREASIIRKGQAFALVFILFAGSFRLLPEKYDFFTPMPFSYISSINESAFSLMSRKLFKTKRADLEKAETDYHDTKVVVILVEKLSDKYFKDNSTYPLMSKMGFNVLTGIKACSTDSETAAICGLTRATIDNFAPAFKEKSVTSLFKSAGFTTYWLVAHNMFSIVSPNVRLISKEADNYKVVKSNGSLNPFLAIDDFSDAIESVGNSFIVVQTDGLTPYFGLRYSDIFNNHTPSCISRASVFKSSDRCTSEEAENSYKNYISSIDAFVYEIAKRVKNMNSVIIVAGMAGENTSETNMYGEANVIDNTVPVAIWFSKSLDDDKKLTTKLENNKNTIVNQSELFHIIAGCGGLNSTSIDKNFNLCK